MTDYKIKEPVTVTWTYRKGRIVYIPESRAWLVVFSAYGFRCVRRLYLTHSLAMSEYREHDRKVRESLMVRKPTATPRAVLTTDGIILRGDSDHREGDPIINRRTGKVHYVHTVDPSVIEADGRVRKVAQTEELPLDLT